MRLHEACARGQRRWPHVEAFYDRTWGDFQMTPHTHTWCEVMYVFQGVCQVVLTGVEPILMRAGDYIFLDAGVEHQLLTDAGRPCSMLNVEFSLAELREGAHSLRQLAETSADFAEIVHQAAPTLMGSDLHGQLFRAMDMLLAGLLTPNEQPALRATEMALFLLRLAQVAAESRQRVGPLRYIRDAVAYMQHHYAEKITVPMIAKKAGISADYLGHLFKAYLGGTVWGYLSRIRNDHAATLLLRSQSTLDDIALEVGYGSRQQLTRCFRAQFGLSPFAYRKRHQKPSPV